MSTTVLKDSPASITYEDVRPLLDVIVRQFKRKYGRDEEESLSELNVAFVEAYDKYDPDRGSFQDCVYFMGYKRLLEKERLAARRNKKLHRTDCEMGTLHSPTDFNVVDFMDELSADAQRVVRLTLQTPRTLLEELEERGSNPKTFRSVLRAHLIFLGWTRDRVCETFNEIQTVLGSW